MNLSRDDVNHVCKLEPFRVILEPLMSCGWQSIHRDTHANKIVINKKFNELEEINIEYKNFCYHFSLPINNSIYSYYIKNIDQLDSITFLNNYINNLII